MGRPSNYANGVPGCAAAPSRRPRPRRPGGEGVHLSISFDADAITVLSNRIKVKQMALNLPSNAARYTKASRLELAMGGQSEGGWYLRVADTGVGIAPPDCDRIFDESERAAGEDIPGVGLGLAIVKELCRVLDGGIRFGPAKVTAPPLKFASPCRSIGPATRMRSPLLFVIARKDVRTQAPRVKFRRKNCTARTKKSSGRRHNRLLRVVRGSAAPTCIAFDAGAHHTGSLMKGAAR